MTKTNVLILASRTGGGHVSLAESLQDRIGQDYEVRITDVQSALFLTHYRLVSRHALWLWGTEYRVSNTPNRAYLTHLIFTLLSKHKLVRLIRDYQPSLIFTTYAYYTYATIQALKDLRQNVPLGILFSDPLFVHAAWLTYKNAEATLAPTRDTVQEALDAGFDPERVHLTGWPVRGQFYEAYGEDVAAFRHRLNLAPDRLTIFLQGGGEGTAKFTQTVENLLHINRQSSSPVLQIILATGTNEALRAQFLNVEHCYPLPFTKKIAPYMAAADLIMGKAGPNMLFESVTLGKPFIATTYIPGQETPNLDFIRDNGLGWVALTTEEQHTLIQSLLQDQAQINAMYTSVDRYRQWNTQATEGIPGLVRKLVA